MTPATRMMAPTPVRIYSRRRRLLGGGRPGLVGGAPTSAGWLAVFSVCVVLHSIFVNPFATDRAFSLRRATIWNLSPKLRSRRVALLPPLLGIKERNSTALLSA